MTKCKCKHSIVLVNTLNVLNKGTLICTTHNPCFMIFLSMAFQAAQSWQCRPISSPWERFLDGGLSVPLLKDRLVSLRTPTVCSPVYQAQEPCNSYLSCIDPGIHMITLNPSPSRMNSAYGIFHESCSVAFIQLFWYLTNVHFERTRER